MEMVFLYKSNGIVRIMFDGNRGSEASQCLFAREKGMRVSNVGSSV